ncbi:uncharacterized protein LOC116293487, partial [Actinia tenebrosa]|uniref:Uncharacterized protein LOC116293487 n=1 Tax=Actinia tenebrosa TaxID=6105 RepID=A0A6P8HM23_ACTTE
MTANINTSYLNPLKTATNLTENDGVPGSRFDADPGNYTVYQLKRWLKCRDLKVTGKRSELLARVQDCINAGNYRILDPSIDGGRWLDIKVSKEYSKDGKIIKEPKNKVPEIPTSGWKNFPSNDIPAQFNYGHVYLYALESLPSRSESEVVDQTSDDSDDEAKGHGLGHMTDKPFKNGRKYVDSGFVHDVTDNKNSDYYFLRAHVWPSMKTDLPHNVLIILSIQSGAVIHASCEPCKASELGRCSHVVAVLLLLLD